MPARHSTGTKIWAINASGYRLAGMEILLRLVFVRSPRARSGPNLCCGMGGPVVSQMLVSQPRRAILLQAAGNGTPSGSKTESRFGRFSVLRLRLCIGRLATKRCFAAMKPIAMRMIGSGVRSSAIFASCSGFRGPSASSGGILKRQMVYLMRLRPGAGAHRCAVRGLSISRVTSKVVDFATESHPPWALAAKRERTKRRGEVDSARAWAVL
jgi:hypothetical protein